MKPMLARLALALCLSLPLATQAQRGDVLVVVNDNSADSLAVGGYYAQRRGLDPARVVHVKVPNQFQVSWTQFQGLRDQILRFGICPSLPLGTAPVACSDTTQPLYTAANLAVLTALTPIRYVVTTRGVPARMSVDGSTLLNPTEATSVDNYLRFWLARYLASDVDLGFAERMKGLGISGTSPIWTTDGKRTLRPVAPASDLEYVIGRIDGVDVASAEALVDRALEAEAAGVYGKLYTTTDSGTPGYGSYASEKNVTFKYNNTWRYPLGLFGESSPECADYTSPSHYFSFPPSDLRGKTPAHCLVKLEKGDRNTLAEPIWGLPGSRAPIADDALAYFGQLDGQQIAGGFATLLDWRKDATCTSTLCATSADPAACAAASTDPYREIDTRCVGVAPGFIGYNFQSYPVANPLGAFPAGWNPAGQNTPPEIVPADGADGGFSAWLGSPGEVASPTCWDWAGGLLGATQSPCPARREAGLSQEVGDAPADASLPPSYRLSFQVRGEALPGGAVQAASFAVIYDLPAGAACPAGTQAWGTTQCRSSVTRSVALPAGTGPWQPASFDFTPVAGLGYRSLTFTLLGTASGGRIGYDLVSLVNLATGRQLARNGSFDQGHAWSTFGDFATNFLGRLGGTAFWGSLSHHQSNGWSFQGLPHLALTTFARGLPLGDAVWLGETRNSGILYGDPLYSPLQVRLDALPDPSARFIGSVNLAGATVNGTDAAQVTTTWQTSWCPGKDFYPCDRAGSWTPLASGAGGQASQALGRLKGEKLPGWGDYVVRLAVTSTNARTGRSQTFNDHYRVTNRYTDAEVSIYTLSGLILDPAGQPLAGIAVRVDGPDGTVTSFSSDATGRYRALGLQPGTYTVTPLTVGYTFAAATGSATRTIKNGHVTDLGFVATPVAGGAVTGRVTDATGQPLAGVRVTVTDAAGLAVTVATSVHGAYRLFGLAAGAYGVVPLQPGLGFTAATVAVGATAAVQDFTAQASDLLVSGVVTGTSGLPEAGLGLMALYSTPAGVVSAKIQTNASGYFLFAGMAGQPRIYLDLSRPWARGLQFSAADQARMPFTASVTDFNPTLVSTLTRSIAGYTDFGDAGLGGVPVVLRDAAGAVIATTTSATSGYYLFTGMKDGTYTVEASFPDPAARPPVASRTIQVNGVNFLGANLSSE